MDENLGHWANESELHHDLSQRVDQMVREVSGLSGPDAALVLRLLVQIADQALAELLTARYCGEES